MTPSHSARDVLGLTPSQRARYDSLTRLVPDAGHDRLLRAAIAEFIPLQSAADTLRMGPLPPLGAPVPTARRQVTADQLLRCLLSL